MKRRTLALTFILTLLVSVTAGAKLADDAAANPYPYTNCSSSFVTVSILSPENKTYDTNNIQVTIFAGAYPGVWYVGYSVDGGPFTEVAPGHNLGHTLNESVWLNQLSKGTHNIVAQATTFAPHPEGKLTAYSQVNFTITDVLSPELQIMSFEQAVQAANASSHNETATIADYELYIDLKNKFYNESGVSGYLSWLAPNGTLYGAEYPERNLLGVIGEAFGESDWNPPNGYYVWILNYEDGAQYFVLATNGTILHYSPPRYGGPISPATQPTFPHEPVFVTAALILGLVIVCSALLFRFRKRKRR